MGGGCHRLVVVVVLVSVVLVCVGVVFTFAAVEAVGQGAKCSREQEPDLLPASARASTSQTCVLDLAYTAR